MKSRRKKRNKRDKKRGIYLLPNLFTSASLFGGFYAIIAAIQHRFEAASVAILVSCLFDALDGKVARYTHTSSHFGTEYDSLSDLVAFGVAPGILAFQWALQPYGRLGWLASFTYVICGALRLARFNIQNRAQNTGFFKGLPIPSAAALIASLILFTSALGGGSQSLHVLALVVVYLLSFLMVSSLDYLSFKKFETRRQKPFNVLVSIILMLIVVAYRPRIVLFFIISAYVISGPITTILRTKTRRASITPSMVDLPFISTKDEVDEAPDTQAAR
ncbi:MAG: CDP-diacylglycerol--serine O-phosphatidyltransferase [Deltaproteobacteria bacterium]|nr:CDP-diacylglycerol--serine O-phosphatidyltransferase [Deltaproteobacteria bacterium]MBW1929572.1 CDP-diacylglycerol--serine O-phosphatidyltransferase [Deltaproteobacteria bacterium]MBW2025083.1 CDP-diacylglycerol--serine O-phosphatidyltransferase [Deltaproteobacteria bacterium]MBW2124993.1 CDP-diacylglycerol--serine O-phosphatidyltransferase [Deltaproteobacteria bacterium]RLB15925.1 MAG: CDP-diacylglycerol--serine O-phosphatidyltransferase [Deltaproteobacteria bacterium]